MINIETIVVVIISVIGAILASTGFWTYLQGKAKQNSLTSDVLVGLAHDRILYLGMRYVERGWISKDEYENLYDYLYLPYKQMGGNGAVERVIREVNKLPIKQN